MNVRLDRRSWLATGEGKLWPPRDEDIEASEWVFAERTKDLKVGQWFEANEELPKFKQLFGLQLTADEIAI